MTASPPAEENPRAQWLLWLLLFFALSYKHKVLGEAAVRPLYLWGVVYGVGLMVHLSGIARQRTTLAWRSIGDAGVVAVLLLVTGYILLQSLAYPESFNDVAYATATALLVFGVSFFSFLAWGWQASALAAFKALLHYSVVNCVLLILSVVHPPSVSGILVSPLDTGFGARLSGLPGDPTHLGSLLALTLLLMFALRSLLPARMIFRVLLIVVFLVISGSRNAFLSLAVAGLAASITEPRFAAPLLRALAVAAVLALVAATVILLEPDVADYVATVFRVDDPNAYSRFDIWLDMAEIVGRMTWFERLFGGGYLYIQQIYGSPYNAFLRIFFGHGFLVFAAFLGATLALFVYAATDPVLTRRRVSLALLSFWFVFSMFLDTAYAEFFHFAEFCFWFAAALVTTRSLQRRPLPLKHRGASSSPVLPATPRPQLQARR